MKTNEISAKVLNTDARSWIEKLRNVLHIQGKVKGTKKLYWCDEFMLKILPWSKQYYASSKIKSIKKLRYDYLLNTKVNKI